MSVSASMLNPGPQAAHDPTTSFVDDGGLRVAFVVGQFPAVSETFVIDQVAQLMDRGVAVEIFAFWRGDPAHVSERFFSYGMDRLVQYLDFPVGKLARIACAWPKALRLAVKAPRALVRALNVARFGRDALSLRLLYQAEPLAARDYDVLHCHFGTIASWFVPVSEVLGMSGKVVTSFYGYDVSLTFREQAPDYYEPLKRVCTAYFVMSHDMKRRVVAQGFPAEQVKVHPVSVEVADYPFRVRTLEEDEPLHVVSVGRFVEKKGLDDLLRAMAIVQQRASRPVSCSIVGDGPLDQELRVLAESLELTNAVEFRGFMMMEDILRLFASAHVLVQPSKTAADGDME